MKNDLFELSIRCITFSTLFLAGVGKVASSSNFLFLAVGCTELLLGAFAIWRWRNDGFLYISLFTLFGIINLHEFVFHNSSVCECFPGYAPPVWIMMLADVFLSLAWLLVVWDLPSSFILQARWIAAFMATFCFAAALSHPQYAIFSQKISIDSPLPTEILREIEGYDSRLYSKLSSGEAIVVFLQADCVHCESVRSAIEHDANTIVCTFGGRGGQDFEFVPSLVLGSQAFSKEASIPFMARIKNGSVESVYPLGDAALVF